LEEGLAGSANMIERWSLRLSTLERFARPILRALLTRYHDEGLAAKLGILPAKLAEYHQALETAKKRWNELRNEMAERNLSLVVFVAKRIRSKHLNLLERISAGHLGLLSAIEVFDHTRGYAFSTWAVARITRHIRREIEQAAKQAVRSDTSPSPFRPDAPPRSVVSLDKLAYTRDMVMWAQTSESDEGFIRWLRTRLSSWEKRMESADETRQKACLAELKGKMAKVLATIAKREADVIRRLFGLDSGVSRTLREVGRELGKSTELVRQLKGRALRKLQNPVRARQLTGFAAAAGV
jgi:RNA polymerase sigma factor (sigma-70 family)